jgi:hypothetical protein
LGPDNNTSHPGSRKKKKKHEASQHFEKDFQM